MSSHIQRSRVGLEATLSDSKKKYGDKVNALLSAWEHVTNFVPAATPETTQSLIEWVHKHTLKLVLRGEWPKLSPATKTHLSVTLQRCATHLAHHPVASKCTALIALVHNPWVHPALDSILNGKPDSEHEEEFCCSEKGELLTMRLKILCEDRCEDIAVNLAAACVRSLRRSEGLCSVSEAHHVHYMIDVYIVLLYKLKRTQDIFAQLKLMDLNDGLELVQRLSGEKLTKYRTARVWRNSLKAAELVAQYLVTAGMVRPVSETGANVLEQILNSWAILHSKLKDVTPTLPGMIRKLIEPAESAQHIYIFCAVLTKHFGESIKPLMIELYIRALTTDMNELETQKAKSDKDKVRETAKRLSTQFLKLSEVVVDSIGIARECVLTAFSLNPTRACYDRIKEVAIACGKAKRNDETPVKTEELPSSNATVKEEQKCFDLKTLLVPPRKSDINEECRLHPKRSASTEGPLGELCFNCGEFTGKKPPEASVTMERSLDALILIKGEAVTGSANYDEKSVPNQVLDAEKLGLSPQLCDDLAVVLSSPRYHMLSWVLDWKELNGLCERYLENAEGMRNTNKELKYLNIDYSQFKDWPSEEDTKDVFFGIEKGYEQWADVPSDNSEEFGSFQPAGTYKRSLTRRSLDDTTDSESGVRRAGRQRKIHRLESSDSDYEDSEEKSKVFRNRTISVSDSDTNTQDSQTDSLGSDGCRQEKKPNKSAGKDISKNRGKSKLTVESVSHFHMLMNENIRRPGEDVSGSDMSSNDIITLFSADMDENKRETIKGSVYTAASPLIITEKRSDPAVLKSLRMFRPSNTKKPTRIAQILQKNLLNKSKDNNNVGGNSKFSTINLNPKIVLTRTDEASKKVVQSKKQLSAGDITNELINIQKSMPFSPNKNAIGTYQKRKGVGSVKGVKSSLGKMKYDILAKAVRDSDILAKNVPGLNSLDMMVPPRVQSTVNVVQLSRNISQSPNTGSVNSGNTPPRNRTSTIAGNIQLPGTPSSGGHDSGVGMSPAGQTPPPRSNLHDLGEDANQPLDSSPVGLLSTSNIEREILTERLSRNSSPKKTPPPTSTVPITSDQLQILCKPYGTYQLASITPNPSGQRNILTLQNLEESNVNFPRQQAQQQSSTSTRPTYDRPSAKPSTQSGLPKFQQAFGKTIYTMSTDTTTVAASATTETISQPTTVQKAANLSKAVQTSVQNTGISVQSVIPNFQVSTGRQILNIVQSSGSTTNVTTSAANQTLAQLVQNTSSGVIYTQKIPVSISTTNPNQISLIPNSISVNRTPGVVKLNIIRAPIRQQNLSGALQVLAAPRIQQTVRNESLISSPIEVPNQVSSTTLEQLREFESVLEQVKERSTVQPQHQTSTAATTTVQTQTSGLKHSVSALAQQLLMPSQTATNSEFSSNGNNTVTFQQEVFPQKVSLAYTTSKGPSSTPVVVVTSYCQPAASPALSVTSQSSSSPCATPAPAPVPSAGKTPPSSSSKSAKKAAPKTVKTSATNTSKASPIPKPQQKPQEDEQTAQRIYAILDEYAEQLRNSPDLNNKPAPRRRSNPPTNPSQTSKRKKSSSSKSKPVGVLSAELSPSTDDLGRTMGSEDSSSGIVHVQDSPAGFSGQEEPSTTPSMDTSNLTNDSNDGVELNMKRRNLIFTEPSRTVIVQEAVQTAAVSVSEALASVTGKMGNTAVLVPGTNYILPMNLMKGGQQFTIVSGGSKLLAAVPTTVRTTGGNTGVSNALVLQSILNQAGKIISQPKPVKIPTLQNLTVSQSLSSQNVPVIIPQTSANVENAEKNHCDGFTKNDSCTRVSADVARGNKSPGMNLIQRSVNEIAESQQICGVITSSPSLTLQGTRLFNSSIAKLSSPAKTESVVCLEKKESNVQEKPVAIQTATIALAFAPQSEVSVISNSMQKDMKESTRMEVTSVDKVISPKSVKRKMEDMAVGLMESLPRTLISTNSIVTSTVATALQSSAKIESAAALTAATKQPTVTDTTAHYLISAGASSINSSHQSPPRQSHENIETASKVGNGILCGNARLQEAWEPERKSSPDTPWRYVPTSTNQMTIEPLKAYTREHEHPDNVHSILQIINKGQGIEMASGQVYQTSTKKYFMNHTLEPFQQYSNKSMVKAQPTARLDRELLQQRMERKAAAIERELRLQKSLSEECEDLGVDEPSTSDLFPEADLLFDTNHSPSFDHSSQDASCSQPLGLKSYNAAYFRPLDSSSSSRDASPVTDFKITERRKNVVQRTRTIKDTVQRAKRDKLEDLQIENPAKHVRLSLENLSQDDSTSDVSRLSPIQLLENDCPKDTSQPISRVRSRNGSKEASPSSISSIPSNMKLDIDMDCESLPPGAPAINPPSSGDESLTLLGGNTADVTISSPLSPIVGPLPSTHKYTYSNKKRTTSKLTRTEYLSWESPISEERTRSSSEDEDSSVSESMSSQPENGIDDNIIVKTPIDHCTYLKKKGEKVQISARVVLNRSEPRNVLVKRRHVNESFSESGALSSDKTSEPSDDETNNAGLAGPDCRARRSSLRGNMKKGCTCCNGSPERPKKKSVKLDHKLKKRLASKQLGKKR